MQFQYAAAAVEEVSEALANYQALDANLSKRMVREIDDALARIQRFPEGWHPLSGGLRQLRRKSFPYLLIYKVQSESIAVVAFASTHRRPGYWRDRLTSP